MCWEIRINEVICLFKLVFWQQISVLEEQTPQVQKYAFLLQCICSLPIDVAQWTNKIAQQSSVTSIKMMRMVSPSLGEVKDEDQLSSSFTVLSWPSEQKNCARGELKFRWVQYKRNFQTFNTHSRLIWIIIWGLDAGLYFTIFSF